MLWFSFWDVFYKFQKLLQMKHLEIYNNNDQPFNRHDFLIKSSLIIWYIDFVMTTYLLNVHVC